MAEKRKLKVVRPAEPEPNKPGHDDQTWTDWSKSTYVRYWYVVIAMATTGFSALEVARHDEWGPSLTLALLTIFVIGGAWTYGYYRLWGPNGIWRNDPEG